MVFLRFERMMLRLLLLAQYNFLLKATLIIQPEPSRAAGAGRHRKKLGKKPV